MATATQIFDVASMSSEMGCIVTNVIIHILVIKCERTLGVYLSCMKLVCYSILLFKTALANKSFTWVFGNINCNVCNSKILNLIFFSKEADIGVTLLRVTPNRSDVVDFLTPIWYEDRSFVIKIPEENNWMLYVSLFQVKVLHTMIDFFRNICSKLTLSKNNLVWNRSYFELIYRYYKSL